MVERRKTVTVLFCDVVESTALGESTDAEVLRAILARYFERMRAIVEAHGGTVEKFIGDAVMAVFGVPVAHEDDALRACRAAVEMRDALPSLELEGRIGVMTGEVVTGTEERLATGDAVNVAARLQQAAQPGEVLVGEPVVALVGGAVDVDELEPLALKGKAAPIRAFRLLAAREASERHRGERFVGRERELALIASAWQRAHEEQRCELVTIVGEAGVGKSHLVAEAIRAIDGRVVQGRCLPYGEGITYWPVVDVIKQLDVVPSEPAARAALSALLGESEAPTSAEDIAWAFRKLLEQEAPLVVVFDDIQWAEVTFLDLVEHVSLLSTGSPILLLCMARPELRERGRDWPVGINLESLGQEDVDRLIGQRLPPATREAIAAAASGNPLFVSEMLAMAAESDGDVPVPPTLRALLAERLDQLDAEEREVLERGAIEGEVFHRSAVRALAAGQLQVTPRLAALVRKQLIRPDRAQLAGEDGFRFRHLLIRDVAYESLPKIVRAELHERFAGWLEQNASELVELDELAGYHLEQACGYRNELGQDDADLAQRAAEHLRRAAETAVQRADQHATVNLLSRTLALLPEGIYLDLRLQLSEAQMERGDLDGGVKTARDAARLAHLAGDSVSESAALLHECVARSWFEPDAMSELGPLVERLAAKIEGSDNARARLALASAKTDLYNLAWLYDDVADDLVVAKAAAVAAGRPDLARTYGLGRIWYLFAGSASHSAIAAAIQDLDENERELLEHANVALVGPAVMAGDFDRARGILDRALRWKVEHGSALTAASWGAEHGFHLELVAGDPAAAERWVRHGIDALAGLGEKGHRSSALCDRAEALVLLGELDEADRCLAEAATLASPADIYYEFQSRRSQAQVLTARGQYEEAEALARDALTIVLSTQSTFHQAASYACLAEVLARVGKPAEAATAREEALALCARKEAPAYAAYINRRLDALIGAVSGPDRAPVARQ